MVNLSIKKKFKLGYSTCPNDTFIFNAIANGKIKSKFDFDIELHDVETLNKRSLHSYFDISKISFAALGHVLDKYKLLMSGSALGRGCGPLIVAKKGFDLHNLKSSKIAVPGIYTTAYMLLSLYLNRKIQIETMTFDEIMPGVINGNYDAGVIIHESRFTYEKYGLVKLIDLGDWWEQDTGLPIPLGGIVVKRETPKESSQYIEHIIQKSIEYSQSHLDYNDPYIKKNAGEIDTCVIRKHIELYVNKFSVDLGKEGRFAIEKLFEKAEKNRIIPEIKYSIF